MKTKDRLLELLELNRGEYFSGEEIAQRFSVSRAAVWKAVKTLQGEGYDISAVTNRGYCLSLKTDILSPQGIQKYLKPECRSMELCVLPTAKSTNTLVYEKAVSGQAEGYAVFSNEQTEGRGRYGRTFYSPCKTGIYMSLLLRPDSYSAKQAVRITTMAAVAMCETIEAVSGKQAQIKWVNDIFIDGKKVCGILTDASFGLESGMLEFAVLGIGLNVYYPSGGFPDDIRDIAGAVFHETRHDMKNRLAAEFLNRFMAYYAAENQCGYIEKYRERCFVIGRHIMVNNGDRSRGALALGIDDACRLLVRYDDGTEEYLMSGDISIRL